jgi:hypothetical protein
MQKNSLKEQTGPNWMRGGGSNTNIYFQGTIAQDFLVTVYDFILFFVFAKIFEKEYESVVSDMLINHHQCPRRRAISASTESKTTMM